MMFSFSDPWYVTALKLAVLGLALLLAGVIARQSVGNLRERMVLITGLWKDRNYKKLVSSMLSILYKFFFLWVLLQVFVVLFFGFFGISSHDLKDYHFQMVLLVVALCMFSTSAFCDYGAAKSRL